MENYCDWLTCHPDLEDMAICTQCSKSFDVSNMGEAALKSYARGGKQSKLAKRNSQEKSKAQLRISDLWSAESNATAGCCSKSVPLETECRPAPTAGYANPNGEPTSFVTKDVLTSEIWWALKMVTSYFSLTSNIGISDFFRRMFPDSSVAKEFSFRDTKARSCFLGMLKQDDRFVIFVPPVCLLFAFTRLLYGVIEYAG